MLAFVLKDENKNNKKNALSQLIRVNDTTLWQWPAFYIVNAI